MNKYTIVIENTIDFGVVEGFKELYQKYKSYMISTYEPKYEAYGHYTIHKYTFEFEDIEKYAWFNNELVNLIQDFMHK